jgi:hypothetical protein
MGDDSIVEAIGMGSILVEVMVKGQIRRIRIKEVLHVPSNFSMTFKDSI